MARRYGKRRSGRRRGGTRRVKFYTIPRGGIRL